MGSRGAVSAGHPLGAAAGQEVFAAGGNAVDAAIAAQAALCVVIPASCGIGGDGLALVKDRDGSTTAVNGTGLSPADAAFNEAKDGGLAVTVPGMVDAWAVMSERFGTLDLARCLAPSVRLARDGVRFGADMVRALGSHAARLEAGGAAEWCVRTKAPSGGRVIQPELARLLEAIAAHGPSALYRGEMAEAVERAVAACGGRLAAFDLASHETDVRLPVSAGWNGGRAMAQPPMTQGILLPMCLKALAERGAPPPERLDHVLIELTQAAFAFRDRVADGEALLDLSLDIDADRASNRGGPRAYLHTTGVATADDEGRVVSSLISVFDEFGSGVFVPEGGFVLNNRAQGFTAAPNDAAPAKRPVHTLAPAMLEREGATTALATPGADGQIQTLLQIIARHDLGGTSLEQAIHAPRWRSEAGKLLIAANHPQCELLDGLGHRLVEKPDGDTCFGGVVCAGIEDGAPFAISDWRREVWSAVA